MRVVFAADLHVHAHRADSARNGADRLGDGLSALRQTLDHARRLGCPWVFGGDVKEPRRVWPHDALTGVLSVLREYDDVRKVMVKGNHDGEGEYGSGLQPFARHAEVCDAPDIFCLDGEDAFAVWPAVSDPAWRLDEFVASVPERVRVLVGHGYVAGAKLGPDDFRAPGGLALETMGQVGRPRPRFDVVLLGDVHRGQQLARPARGKAPDWVPFAATSHLAAGSGPQPLRGAGPWRGEVFYAGSPYQLRWDERADGPKGALLVDLGTGQVDLLPVAAPRYVEEVWPERPVDGDVSPRWGGNLVRLVAGPWAREKKGQELIARFRDASEPRSLRVEIVEPRRDERRTEVHGGMSSGEMLRAYVAARPPSVPGADAESVLAAGVSLLEGE